MHVQVHVQVYVRVLLFEHVCVCVCVCQHKHSLVQQFFWSSLKLVLVIAQKANTSVKASFDGKPLLHARQESSYDQTDW